MKSKSEAEISQTFTACGMVFEFVGQDIHAHKFQSGGIRLFQFVNQGGRWAARLADPELAFWTPLKDNVEQAIIAFFQTFDEIFKALAEELERFEGKLQILRAYQADPQNPGVALPDSAPLDLDSERLQKLITFGEKLITETQTYLQSLHSVYAELKAVDPRPSITEHAAQPQ